MKNITPLELDKYKENNYELVDGPIYKCLDDGNYKLAISLELEEGEDSQYPLEDILDKFYINVAGLFEIAERDGNTILEVELEGSLKDANENLANLKSASEIIGKRVYNKKNENGRLSLVVE